LKLFIFCSASEAQELRGTVLFIHFRPAP
jgi:hypothetical protein